MAFYVIFMLAVIKMYRVTEEERELRELVREVDSKLPFQDLTYAQAYFGANGSSNGSCATS